MYRVRQKRGHMFDSTSSQCLKQFAYFLTNFSAVLFWTHYVNTMIKFVTHSGATWWQTTRFTLMKNKSGCCLKPGCFLISVQTFWKIDCTNITLSFKDIFDVSTVVLQNASRQRHKSLMPDACTTPPLLTAYQISNKKPNSITLSSSLAGRRAARDQIPLYYPARDQLASWCRSAREQYSVIEYGLNRSATRFELSRHVEIARTCLRQVGKWGLRPG